MRLAARSWARRGLPLALVAGAVGSGSCGATATDGPLSHDQQAVVSCFQAPRPNALVMLGSQVLTNRSGRDVQLTGVDLRDPVNLQVVESSLVPIENHTTLGDGFAYPPTDAVFARRVPAAGATLAAGQPDVNLVLGVRVTGNGNGDATAAGERVRYRADGHDYVFDTTWSFKIVRDVAECGPTQPEPGNS